MSIVFEREGLRLQTKSDRKWTTPAATRAAFLPSGKNEGYSKTAGRRNSPMHELKTAGPSETKERAKGVVRKSMGEGEKGARGTGQKREFGDEEGA